MTISATLASAITSITQGGAGTLLLTGTHAANFSTASGIAGNLQLQGVSTTFGGVVAGPGTLTANHAAGNTLTMTSASTYAGGTTIGPGVTLAIGANSALTSGGMTSSPVGLGALTLNAGDTLRTTSATAQTINNDLVVNGDFTFGTLTSTSGNLTIDPFSRGGSVTFTKAGVTTITLLGGTLTITGAIKFPNGGSLRVLGSGTLILNNNSGAASNPAAIVIGDGVTVSGPGVGGNLQVNSQSALGSGSHHDQRQRLPRPLDVVRSDEHDHGPVRRPRHRQRRRAPPSRSNAGLISLPTAGVLDFYYPTASNSQAGIVLSGAYPTLTGTLVLTGYSTNGTSGSVATLPTLLSSDGTPRTIAFDTVGGNVTASGLGNSFGNNTITAFGLGGVILNADLTIAGGSTYAVLANNPIYSEAFTPIFLPTVGPITETGGSHRVTVAMAPGAAVQMTPRRTAGPAAPPSPAARSVSRSSALGSSSAAAACS